MGIINGAKRLKTSQVYNGDCTLIMKDLLDNSVDLLLIDPPYQIEYLDMVAQKSYKDRGLNKKVEPIKNDSKGDIDWNTFFEESYRILKPKKMLYMCCRLDVIVEIGEFIKHSKFKYSHRCGYNGII